MIDDEQLRKDFEHITGIRADDWEEEYERFVKYMSDYQSNLMKGLDWNEDS